ncbi:MAG: transporter [Gammaproteobacteria bacterium]
MMNEWGRLWVIATVGRAVLVASGAAQGAPITFDTALPVGRGEFIWREQVISREREADGLMDPEVSATALANVLGYGVTGKLALFGVIPYFFERELEATTPMGRITRDTEGFGDLTLFGRYTAYQYDRLGSTFRIAPTLGVKAPTGDDDDRDAFGELPRALQVGTGAWDGFAGIVGTYQTLEYQTDAQLLYRVNGEDEGFSPGDEVRLDASLQYRLWPRELKTGVPAFVYGVLETNLSHRERDEVGGRTNPDSGGTQWFITPGLQYVGRRWVLEAAVQLPAVQDLHGDALEDEYIVNAGFRFNF